MKIVHKKHNDLCIISQKIPANLFTLRWQKFKIPGTRIPNLLVMFNCKEFFFFCKGSGREQKRQERIFLCGTISLSFVPKLKEKKKSV
jgi:hypothetical protein